MTSPIGSSDPYRRRDHDDESNPSATGTSGATATSASPRSAAEASRAPGGNVSPEIDWDDDSSLPAGVLEKNLQSHKSNRDVMYMGMNETVIGGQKQNEAEWKAMQEQAAHFGVRAVRVATSHESIVPYHGVRYELSSLEGCHAFVDALKLSDPRTSTNLKDVLANARVGGRDELARIAIAWSGAEREGTAASHTVPSRIILSAHHSGGTFYDGASDASGASSERVTDGDILALARAMPHAAAQVKDIMFSACSTLGTHGGGAETVERLRSAFPNLHSVQGYGSPVDFHSPTGSTAIVHEQNWMFDTRTQPGVPLIRNGSAFGDHAAIWSPKDGIKEGGR
jgi:hypothetical protein